MKKLMLGLLMAFALAANAGIVKSYTLSDSLTATLDDQGVLKIIGSGAMPNWMGSSDQVWANEVGKIKSVVGEGVTSIGDYAFDRFHSLTSVSLPNATTLGKNALSACRLLTSVFLPNVTLVEECALGDNSSLTSVSLPKATSVGMLAFAENTSLVSVSLPKAVSVGQLAFEGSSKLGSLVLGWELLPKIDRAFLGLSDDVRIYAHLPKVKIESGSYNVAVECGDEILSSGDYAKACAYYGITPKTAPEIVREGEIAVKKASIAAAKAESISIEGGVVTLNVGVSSNGNFTVETANWEKARIMDAKLNDDGTVKLTVPTSSSSGFMILQPGDAKLGE